MLSWARGQTSLTLSSGESEFNAIILVVLEALRIQHLLEELGVKVGIEVCTDSSAAKGAAERVGIGRMKHMQVKRLYLKELVRSGVVVLTKVRSEENSADILTIFLPREKFEQCLKLISSFSR